MRTRLIILETKVFMAGQLVSDSDMLPENTPTSQNIVQETNKDAADVGIELNHTFQQLKLKYDYSITTNELRIREFKHLSAATKDKNQFKSTDETNETLAKYDKQVAALKSKNAELKMKLTNYKVDNNWEAFNAKFNHETNDLGKAFADLTINNFN